jgi:hypothetical protein
VRALILLALVLAACSPAAEEPEIDTTLAPTTTSTITSTTSTLPPPEPIRPVWYLVSVTASLPDGLSTGLTAIPGVAAVSTARVGTLDMVESRDGNGDIVDEATASFRIPLEAQAFDPVDHSAYVPVAVARVLSTLDSGEVVLSQTSANLRGLRPDSEIELVDGTSLTVTAVVDDEWVGLAEVVVSHLDAVALGVTNERYAVVQFDGHRSDLEKAVGTLTESAVRIRSRDEVDVFRHADAVASQLSVKVQYGEFAYRPTGAGSIEIDPAWVDANIVREDLPLLGSIVCHAKFVDLLEQVVDRLVALGQTDAIDASFFKGCWNPRFIRERRDLSHHAWGAAADINFGNFDLATDPRLLAAMTAAGIRSGHTWTNPDPGHFEWFPQHS